MPRAAFAAFCLVLVLAAPAPGQATPADALQRRLDEQEARLDALRRELDALRAAPAPVTSTAPVTTDSGAGDWTERFRVGIFFVESQDERYRLEIRARMHLDARLTPERGVHDSVDQLQVRRARVDFQGHLYSRDRITFKAGLEFGRTSDADLRDCYVNLRACDAFEVRGGQFLVPFSTERLTTSNVMIHPERPIAVGSIIGQRDVGIMAHGEVLGGALRYYAAMLNGAGENARFDTDDDSDLALRLEVDPADDVVLLAASYLYSPTDRKSHGPTDVRTVGNEHTLFLDYAPGNRRLGHRERASLDLRVRVGRLEAKGEVLLDYQREVRTAAGVQANLLTWSWFVDVAYVLLGERHGDRIEPAAPLFDAEGRIGAGAVDLALRYEDYLAERDTLRRGFAAGTDRVRAATATVHWYWWTKVRLSASYTASFFDERVADSRGRLHHDDHAVIVRLTLYF